MSKLLGILATAPVLLGGFGVVLTARHVSTPSPEAPAPEITVPAGVAGRLSGAIRIPPISAENAAAFDGAPFRTLHA